MPKCLVTGCSGLIGSSLLGKLADTYELFVLTHQPEAVKAAFPKTNLSIIQGDLNDGHWISKLPNEIDTVIHLAQSLRFREFPDKAEEMFRVNTSSVVKLLDYALKAGAKSFIHASTGGVYGSGDKPFSPDMPLRLKHDLGFYQSTKLCAELLAQSYSQYFNVVTLRPFFVYGKDQRRDMLIPRLTDNVINGKPIKLQGHDGLRINPVHVSDAVRMIEASLTLKQSCLLNIAGKDIFSLRQLGEIIGEAAGQKPIFEIQESSEPPALIGDLSKTRDLLGIEPVVDFSDGIKEVIASSPELLATRE